jgi:hypothetical protein
MIRFARVVAMAATMWLMAGCGGVVVRSAAANGLTLSDAASGTHYELSVADGALTLTGMGSAGTASDPGLSDEVTGSGYRVGVANGSLTLEPGSAGANEIGLVDSVTAKPYELAVSGGALTLIADDGGGR